MLKCPKARNGENTMNDYFPRRRDTESLMSDIVGIFPPFFAARFLDYGGLFTLLVSDHGPQKCYTCEE